MRIVTSSDGSCQPRRGRTHGFFTDTGACYSPTVTAAASRKLLDWFRGHLG